VISSILTPHWIVPVRFFVRWKNSAYVHQGAHVFQKSWINLPVPYTRRAAWSGSHTEDSQVWNDLWTSLLSYAFCLVHLSLYTPLFVRKKVQQLRRKYQVPPNIQNSWTPNILVHTHTHTWSYVIKYFSSDWKGVILWGHCATGNCHCPHSPNFTQLVLMHLLDTHTHYLNARKHQRFGSNYNHKLPYLINIHNTEK
jgi:hypothetical protein